jgi:neutral ceramidase
MTDTAPRPGPAGLFPPVSLVAAVLVAGCFPLDYTPLEDHRFYRKALSIREELRPIPLDSGPLLAGSAKIEITPAVGTPLAGFGGRRSTGVHDPVYARAMVISNGSATLAIVSADVLAMTDDLSEAVVARIGREVPISKANILITATHTHSGPGALGQRFWEQFAAGAFDPRYFDWVVERMARAVVTAHRNLEPSSMMSFRVDGGEWVANRVIPDGPVDPELQVLLFRSEHSPSRTFLVNFAAHPTVLRSRNRLVSGDFPGFLSAELEKTEGTIALYTSGALGEVKARPPSGKGVFERAEKMGQIMAKTIQNAIPAGPGQNRVALSSAKIRIPLPPPQPKISTTRRLPAWIGRLFFDGTTFLQFIRIDRTFLIGIPGDLGSEVGMTWKKTARESEHDVVILGFSNDYIGYIMPAAYYDQPTHESALSFNGPFMADYLGLFVNTFIYQQVVDDGPDNPRPPD